MKTLTKFFAIAAMAISLGAIAADTAPRKEAVLDTGKGGLRLVLSVPGFAEGPIDFAGNKGPAVTNDTGRVYFREAAFNAQVGETGVIVYEAMMTRRVKVDKGDQMITADFLVADILKTEGFTLARATKIDSPPVPIADATIVTYKVSGYPFFDKEKRTMKKSIIVTAVATNDKMQGYTVLVAVAEKDISAFDANPEKFEKRVVKGFGDMMDNTSIKRN